MTINSLDPATETDRARFAERQQIAQQRRAARKGDSATVSAGMPASISWRLASIGIHDASVLSRPENPKTGQVGGLP